MLSLKGSKSDTVDGENTEIKPADRLGTIPLTEAPVIEESESSAGICS